MDNKVQCSWLQDTHTAFAGNTWIATSGQLRGDFITLLCDKHISIHGDKSTKPLFVLQNGWHHKTLMFITNSGLKSQSVTMFMLRKLCRNSVGLGTTLCQMLWKHYQTALFIIYGEIMIKWEMMNYFMCEAFPQWVFPSEGPYTRKIQKELSYQKTLLCSDFFPLKFPFSSIVIDSIPPFFLFFKVCLGLTMG